MDRYEMADGIRLRMEKHAGLYLIVVFCDTVGDAHA